MKRIRIGRNVIFFDDIIATGRILFYFGRLFSVIMTLFCEQSRCWLTKNDGKKNRKNKPFTDRRIDGRRCLYANRCHGPPAFFRHCIIHSIVGHLRIDARRHFLWIVPCAVWICIFHCIFDPMWKSKATIFFRRSLRATTNISPSVSLFRICFVRYGYRNEFRVCGTSQTDDSEPMCAFTNLFYYSVGCFNSPLPDNLSLLSRIDGKSMIKKNNILFR